MVFEIQIPGRRSHRDLGCFLGASTLPLLVGLSENQDPKARLRKIHAFDQFIAEWWCEQLIPGVSVGKRLLDSFLQNIHPWQSNVEVHEGDVCSLGWKGEEIEYLFVDIMKSWKIGSSVTRNFFPALIPGKALLVHQDFKHWYTPWIHLLVHRLRDYCVPVYAIPNSSSLIFKIKKRIPESVCRQASDFRDIRVDEIDSTFRYSLSLVRFKSRVAAAKVMMSWHLDQAEKQNEKRAAFSNPMDYRRKEYGRLDPVWFEQCEDVQQLVRYFSK